MMVLVLPPPRGLRRLLLLPPLLLEPIVCNLIAPKIQHSPTAARSACAW
jgi:hypothetical protein